MTRLRLALLSLHRGGMLHYASGLANSILRAVPGAEVACFCQRDADRGLFDPRVEVFAYPVPQSLNPAHWGELLTLPATLRAVRRDIWRWQPTVLHVNSGHVVHPFLIPALGRRLPVVATLHDVTPHPGEWHAHVRLKLKALLKHSRLIIVHSELLKRQAVTLWGLPEGRFRVVPIHGFEGLRRWATGRAEQPFEILLFGRIYAYKGYDVMLRALPAIVRAVPEARLTIAGAGRLQPWQGRLDDLRPHVRVVNRFLSEAEVAALFEEAAVVALPYLEASQSGVAMVAAAFGKPAVASRVGAIPEAVAEGQTGLLVDPGSVEQLAAAVVRLLKDPAQRAALGQAARRRADTEFGPEATGRQLAAVYRDALAGTGDRSTP
jgi:glycosyltransferase involved in cell wall biosynthesis